VAQQFLRSGNVELVNPVMVAGVCVIALWFLGRVSMDA